MYNMTFADKNGANWKRIDKRRARNLYSKGIDICITSDNFRPFHNFGNSVITNINNLDEYDRNKSNVFDTLVNTFEIYNCIDKQTGYHAAFYIMEG